MAATLDSLDSGLSIAQILEKIIAIAGITDIEHKHRNIAIFFNILAGAEIHSPINLARISTDNFTLKPAGYIDSTPGLS